MEKENSHTIKKNEKVENSSSHSWLKDNNPNVWLLEEYKLLTDHYFHEDTEYREASGIYITINVGLLAFVGSKFFQSGSTLDYLIPIIGIILCFSWLIVMLRIREWRNYIEYRIKEIEVNLHKSWSLNSDFIPLDIRSMKSWKKLKSKFNPFHLLFFLFSNIPSTITMLIIPFTFIIAWILPNWVI